MSARHSEGIARIVFFVCGAITLLLAKAYWFLHVSHFIPGAWAPFAAILIAVGGFSIAIALLPSRWMRSEWQNNGGNSQRFQAPFRILVAFAAASFVATSTLTFAPLRWHPGPQLVFGVCPACVLTITVDPSPMSALLILAPLSAAAYGSLGGSLGLIFFELRRQRKSAQS